MKHPGGELATDLERRFGKLGGREIRTVPFRVDEVRDSGAGAGQFTVTGHAAVFNEWSLDLGYFKERILPGAFDDVLAQRSVDVWHLWDHDTRYVLSRTVNGTLDLTVDERGLRFWSRVAPTTYANDLRILLDRRDIDQSSFAFTVEADEWRIIDDGETERIERDIVKVRDLYDVTTCAMGAYPQTDSELVRDFLRAYPRAAELLASAASPEGDGPVDAAPDDAPVDAATTDAVVNPRLAVLRAKSRSAVKSTSK